MLTHSAIIGKCSIGDKVSIGVNTVIYQKDVESNSVAFSNEDGSLCVKKKTQAWAQNYFNADI